MVSPIVPPICWKNVRLAVALPTWRGSTLFWTSAANSAKDGPTPIPATTIQTHRIGSSVSARRFVRSSSPTARMAIAPKMIGLYRPVRLAICPETVAPTISAKTSGSRFRPDAVAPMPRTDLEPLGQEDDRAEEPECGEEHRRRPRSRPSDRGRAGAG